MMDYEVFKSNMFALISKEIGTREEYLKCKLGVKTLNVVNCKMDVMHMDPAELSDTPVTLAYVCFNEMYECFKSHKEFECIDDMVIRASELLIEKYKSSQEEKTENETPELKKDIDNVVFQLINTGLNKELLETLPHREYHDLSIIYNWLMEVSNPDDESDTYSITTLVDNKAIESLNLTEEDLFNAARENTRNKLIPQYTTIEDIFINNMVNMGFPREIAVMMAPEIKVADAEKMFFISNENKINGATSLLYEDLLQSIADKLNGDVYILPISMNEMAVIPAANTDPNNLAKHVKETNSEFGLEMFLSNNVYFYDRELRKVSLATDVPL